MLRASKLPREIGLASLPLQVRQEPAAQNAPEPHPWLKQAPLQKLLPERRQAQQAASQPQMDFQQRPAV